MTKAIQLQIPDDLIAFIDRMAADDMRTRTNWLTKYTIEALTELMDNEDVRLEATS